MSADAEHRCRYERGGKMVCSRALAQGGGRTRPLCAKLIAPDLVVLEVGNVVWTKVRMGQMLYAQAEFVAGVIPRYFAALVPSAEVSVAAFQIASDLDHPVYDCAYLAVAIRFAAILVTADRRLLTKAANSSYDNLVYDLARPLP